MISNFFLIFGTLTIFIATIGMFTMPDPLSKMHAAAKGPTVGIVSLSISYLSNDPSIAAFFLCFCIVIFLFLTVPVACHAISTKHIEMRELEKNETTKASNKKEKKEGSLQKQSPA